MRVGERSVRSLGLVNSIRPPANFSAPCLKYSFGWRSARPAALIMKACTQARWTLTGKLFSTYLQIRQHTPVPYNLLYQTPCSHSKTSF